MTNEQKIKKMVAQFSEIAGEAVTAEIITGVYYIFGSELATLRIYKKYGDSTNIKQGYSENLKTHYFRIEPKY